MNLILVATIEELYEYMLASVFVALKTLKPQFWQLLQKINELQQCSMQHCDADRVLLRIAPY